MNSLVWFRKGLRLSDNPALLQAIGTEGKEAKCFYPVFVIDPHFIKPNFVGSNRLQFLLESLRDLDSFVFLSY